MSRCQRQDVRWTGARGEGGGGPRSVAARTRDVRVTAVDSLAEDSEEVPGVAEGAMMTVEEKGNCYDLPSRVERKERGMKTKHRSVMKQHGEVTSQTSATEREQRSGSTKLLLLLTSERKN